MPVMLVTCPESAHLEEIEVERTPLGLVISGCSAWSGDRECQRTCAARLDKRARRIGTVLFAKSCLK